jgi:hypothetical protein
MMSLRRWFPLGLIDELFDTGNLAIVRIRQENNFILGIRRQHLGHRAELGRKVRVGEKKTHAAKRLFNRKI